MKRISEIVELATMVIDENTFLSTVDFTIITYNEGKLFWKTYPNAVWDSKRDSVYLMSGPFLDCFLKHTDPLKTKNFVDNYFNDLIEVE